MSVEIIKAGTRKELALFAEFPNVLYKGNPYYVPTIASEDVKIFDRNHNAAFEFCDADFFLAYKDGKLVGRIAAIINPRANKAWGTRNARFGWIDFIDDREVSAALVKAVTDWGAERGMEHLEGPLGFTDFDAEGMLVDGFDELGTSITFYNHPYYMEHLEALGFVKNTDWVERRITLPDAVPEKISRISAIVSQKYGMKAVQYSRREIKKLDIGHKLFDLINNTYNVLYGYSALSDRQVDQYVDLYLSMLDLNLVTFINDSEGNIIAFGVMIPSMSRALQKCDGKMFPFGWYHLAKALYLKKTDTVDMLLIAVRKDYQSKGVPAMIISDLLPRVKKFGFKYAETNPELETNNAVQNLWSDFESRQHRRRRIYGKKI
ncbi:MAG: N-acetyltransferase [Bacteroidales bacterium]|nr:N-acetyltransferase [Candidatus Cryptobacteroides onthequi]